MIDPSSPREDLTPEQFRALGHRVVDWIADYVSTVEQHPVRSDVAPGDIATKLPDHAPEQGESWDEILGDLDGVVMPGVTHWRSPNFFAYFPANV